MRKKYWFLGILLFFVIGLGIGIISYKKDGENKADIQLQIDTKQMGTGINEDLYGLFFEDISKSADGGLNTELLENKSFEQTRDGVKGIFAWQLSEGSYELKKEKGMNINNSTYLHMTVSKKTALKNIGHKGVPINEQEIYQFSFWMQNNDYQGDMSVYVEDTSGNKISEVLLFSIGKDSKNQWKQYTYTLKGTNKGIGTLVIECLGKGTFDIDFISLKPTDTWTGEDATKWPYGGLRADLVKALKQINPGFIRFPGGCVVEGDGLENLYEWKDTIGPLEARKEQKNVWGYWQSYGLGYHEYFQLCEDLGAEPIPVVHAGMTCQSRRPGENYVSGSEALERSIQDTLDLIEYANGEESTYWGKKRAENGHMEPFNLKYIGIGNENWGQEYFKNFNAFKEKIEKIYPNITIITTSGPSAGGPEYAKAWEKINQNYRDTVVDEHFYMAPEWFLANTDRYDYYDRNGAKVFIGEYAAHNGLVNTQVAASGNTLYSALAEAAFMTGIERNGDIVKLASYAPLLAKKGEANWYYNLIWFDHDTVVYTPNYYIQQLFSTYLGNEVLQVTEKKKNPESGLEGGILLGAWSSVVEFESVQVISNKNGKIIFEDRFEDGEINPIWKVKKGTWKEENGVMKQVSSQEGETAIYIDSVDWKDYTLKVQARKKGGTEGFLIGVGVTGPDDFMWYNAGGWGNTKDTIERSYKGARGSIGFTKEGSFLPINTNALYNVEIVCEKEALKVLKNDVVIQEMAIKKQDREVFTSITRDSKSNKIYIKVVNLKEKPISLEIIIKDMNINKEQKMVSLYHENVQAVNSFKNPDYIQPQEKKIDIDDKIEIPAYSANVIIIEDIQK